MRRGVVIGEGEPRASGEVLRLRESDNNSWFEVTLEEGRNQQIRRMFDAIGHSVVKLARTRIGPLEVGRLKAGEWRHPTPREVAQLKGRAKAGTKLSPTKKPSPARKPAPTKKPRARMRAPRR